MKKRLALVTILLTLASSHSVFADSGVINVSSLNLRQKTITFILNFIFYTHQYEDKNFRKKW